MAIFGTNVVFSLLMMPVSLLFTIKLPTTCGLLIESSVVLGTKAVTAVPGGVVGPICIQVPLLYTLSIPVAEFHQ